MSAFASRSADSADTRIAARFREMLVLALAIVVATSTASTAAFALEPEQLRVLDPAQDGPANTLVKKHLMAELRKHFDARRATVKAITTPEQFAERQLHVRETLARINGPFPEKTPLNAKTVGTLDRDGYVIEKVIYHSRPGLPVTANLYLPKGASKERPVPGVIMPCGHSTNGKANDVYQSAAISLALNGMATLIFDPIGQGERYQLLGTDGKPALGSTTEHTLVGVGGWMVGTGTANYRIWDGIRSLDYLASRPEVDASRLGCTGNSGGGTMTSYLMAFDDRIAAAAPSCYITTIERLFDTIGPQDGEQNFPGQVAAGLEHADFLAARAPKPTLICVGTQDYFDIDGAWTTFREAKGIYGLLGRGERIDFFEYNDKHGFSKPRRTAAMRFLRRWLVGKDDNPDEPKHTLSKDAELQCTASGQALNEPGDAVTVFQVSERRAESLAPRRRERWKTPDAALKEAAKRVGLSETIDTPVAEARGTIVVNDDAQQGWTGHVDRLVLTRKDGVPVPSLLFRPAIGGVVKEGAKSAKRPAVVLVSGDGKAAEAGPKGRATTLAAEGKLVLLIDARGWGETAPNTEAARNKDIWFGGDIQLPLLSMHLIRPLLGQRVEDILAAARWLAARDDVAAEKIELVGIGHAGPAALHAAAFDKRISRVTLVRSIRSFAEVVATPRGRNQLQNVVPFALEAYDLPDLAAAIAPRPVTIIEPVDPEGTPLSSPERRVSE